MKVFLVHGGVWDGWWIMEDARGHRRVVKDLSGCEYTAIIMSSALEDVTPDPLPLARQLSRSGGSNRTHLTVVD